MNPTPDGVEGSAERIALRGKKPTALIVRFQRGAVGPANDAACDAEDAAV